MRAAITLITCLAFFAAGCPSEPRRALDVGHPSGPARTEGPESEFGVVSGHARAPGGALLPGVSVRLGVLETQTDARGWFRLQPVEPGDAQILTGTRSGFTQAARPIDVRAGMTLQVELVLAAATSRTLPAAEVGPGSVIETPDGVRVEFVDGSFTDSAGAPVDGPLEISVALLDEASEVGAAPGGMMAWAPDGPFALESFGMAEIVLSSGGAPVTFIGTALVSFPLVAGHPFVDGDTIPLWSYDEVLAAWIDEGEGTVQDDRYHFIATHFSWWNADKPLGQTTCATGSLHTPSGLPAAGWRIDAFGLDWMGSSSATTGPQGAFCLPLRPGGTALVTAIGGDGQAIWALREVVTVGGVAACGGACTQLGALELADLTDDGDGDGWTELAGDCDDAAAQIHPMAPDLAVDGIDDDCDGVDGPDADGDGAAAASAGGGDCDDGRPDVRPGAAERCNGIDDDCDGLVDEPGALGGALVYGDGDGDGFGDPAVTITACEAPPGYVVEAGDCDDSDPDVAPDASERCDGLGLDEDCDGSVDEADAIDAVAWFADADGDGFGDPAVIVTACFVPAGASDDGTDCDDGGASVHPLAIEVCNGADDDCDGLADEAGSVGELQVFVDADGDGYGVATLSAWACLPGPGFALLVGDCDDSAANTHPGATETCADGVDLNCDSSVQFADNDGDGAPACADCDDTDPAVGPAAVERCDSQDSDCDGSLVDFFADSDSDGLPDCIDPDDDGDGAPDAADCAPLDPTIRPGAPEVCDGIDADCDGSLVDGAPDTDSDGAPDCIDPDDDGDGDPDSTDCGPLDAAIHAGALEICDGVDNDCDGLVDSCAGSLADVVVVGEGSGWTLGAAVATGDLDDDGAYDLIVSSPGAGALIGVGAVHVFSGPVAGALFPSQADAVVVGEASEDWAGTSIVADCDLNGDGAHDLIVGAWGYDWTGQATGAVYVLHGPLSGLVLLSSADAVFYGESAGDWAGWSVACAGDTNGDGYDDALVGAWRDDAGGIDAGAAYLIQGPIAPGTVGTLAQATAKLVGESAFDYAGASVAGAGDVDGDGYDDVLVGAWGRDEAGSASGAAYLVRGPLSGVVSLSLADARLLGVAAGDKAGSLVLGIGDLDGDTLDDVLVGAWGANDGGADAGAAYVLYGPIAGDIDLATADATLVGEHAGDQLGRAAARAGDIDGDGYPDLLVGAPGRDVGATDIGAGYLLLGGPAGPQLPGAAAAMWVGDEAGDAAGSALAGEADLDGDGLPDVLVGVPHADSGIGDSGKAFLMSAGGLAGPAALP